MGYTIVADRPARGRSYVHHCSALILLLLLLVPAALKSQTAPQDFSFVLFPDTQNEAQFFPNVLESETQWVVANRTKLNIQAVLGLGDIVNDGASTLQQQSAETAFRILDNAGVPYLLAIGNHDYDGAKPASRVVTGFNQWWGPAHYSGKSYYGQSFPAAAMKISMAPSPSTVSSIWF